MNPCVFIIFSLLLLNFGTTTANQSVVVGGGDVTNGVMNKCFDKERLALLYFKAPLQDPKGRLSTWTSEEDDDCCRWFGVTCNNQTRHLTRLNISLCDLDGEIRHSLLKLSYLNHLDLSYNLFGGTILTFIGSMTRLRYLDLSHNALYGTIPRSIGSLTRLRYLNLGSCYLNGSIPKSIGSSIELRNLDLSYNSLYGTIPRSIGSLTELRNLDLSNNTLYGTIPPEFGNLTNLQNLFLESVGSCRVENLEWLSDLSHLQLLIMDGISLAKQNHWVNVVLSLQKLSFLSLRGCELSQVVYPYSSFLNFSSSVVILALGNNNLTSSMYHWMFPLTSIKLRELDLSNNMLDGIPKYLGDLYSLTYLYLKNNMLDASHSRFTGPLSDKMQKLKNLAHLDMSSCSLGPLFPKWIQTLKNLTHFDISNNTISDTIPLDFWDTWLSQLIYMNLSSNNISGKAPDLSSNFGNSSVIDLSSNSFYGPIKNVSSTVASLNLSRNKFYGGISFLCQIVHGFLSFLDLSHNFLSGQLPDCLWHFKELKVLNLGHNNLSGRLPPSIGSLIQLEVLYLYKNNFSGELPLSLKNITSLNSLILGSNKFSGNVPVWIGDNLWELYVLILRSNNFFGTIPMQLCQLTNLQILDLSMNQLHGNIPSCVSNLMSMVPEGFLLPQNVHSISVLWFNSGGGLYYILNDEYVDNAIIAWQGNEQEFSSNMRLLKMIDLSSNNLTGQILLKKIDRY